MFFFTLFTIATTLMHAALLENKVLDLGKAIEYT